jgi:hypothetical protein
MEVWKKFGRRVAHSGIVLCAFSTAWSVAFAQQTASAAEQSANTAQQSQLPDSPSATRANLQLLAQQQAPAAPQQSAPVSNESQTQSEAPPLPAAQQQPAPQKPVGTAAAEPTHAAGVAASQPAGVAIAPAKQRRVRTIVIRTAAIVGAAVAVGTVVALTEATGSKPPGAH